MVQSTLAAGYADATAGMAIAVMDSAQAAQRPHAFVLSGDGDLWLNLG
jgi:hypothetical protein